MKKIYPADWIKYQPYSKSDSTDVYYANIASRVLMECLDDDDFLYFQMDRDIAIREIAIRLTLWFQDVVSCGGLWTAFTSECKRRYGKPLPFYDIDEDDYYPDEVNREVVRFMLWHSITDEFEDPSLTDPYDPSLIASAEKVFRLFESEFEKAPINDRWHDAFHPEFEGDDWLYDYREYLTDIFVDKNYLDWHLRDKRNQQLSDVADEDLTIDDFIFECHACSVKTLFLGKDGLLGLTSSEWAALVIAGENKSLGAKLFDLETVGFLLRLVTGENETYYYLKDLPEYGCSDTLTYKLHKDSFNISISEHITMGESCIACYMTRSGDEWYLNGFFTLLEYSEFKEHAQLNDVHVSYKVKERAGILYEQFMKATGGKQIVYISTEDEWRALIKRMTEHDLLFDAKQIASIDGPTAVLCTPEDGISLISDNVDCLRDVNNPFYSLAEARLDAIDFMDNEDFVSHSDACALWHLGMLADASCASDDEDYEAGRKLVADNAQFIMDYFLHK